MITVPGVRDGKRLVVPSSTDVHALAQAWFAHARWVVAPRSAAEVLQQRGPAVGARFRGVAFAPGPTLGELALDDVAVLVGPVPLEPEVTRRIAVADDHVAYGIRAAGADAPAADDAAERWVRAVARHAGGVLVAGDVVTRPGPGTAVALRLTTPGALAPGEALALVRRVVPGAVIVREGAAGYALDVPSSYDGSVSLVVRLGAGTAVHETAWLTPSGESDDGRGSGGSSLEAIARERLVPVVAKIVLRLLERVPGEVRDADGFVVTGAELERRAAR